MFKSSVEDGRWDCRRKQGRTLGQWIGILLILLLVGPVAEASSDNPSQESADLCLRLNRALKRSAYTQAYFTIRSEIDQHIGWGTLDQDEARLERMREGLGSDDGEDSQLGSSTSESYEQLLARTRGHLKLLKANFAGLDTLIHLKREGIERLHLDTLRIPFQGQAGRRVTRHGEAASRELHTLRMFRRELATLDPQSIDDPLYLKRRLFQQHATGVWVADDAFHPYLDYYGSGKSTSSSGELRDFRPDRLRRALPPLKLGDENRGCVIWSGFKDARLSAVFGGVEGWEELFHMLDLGQAGWLSEQVLAIHIITKKRGPWTRATPKLSYDEESSSIEAVKIAAPKGPNRAMRTYAPTLEDWEALRDEIRESRSHKNQ